VEQADDRFVRRGLKRPALAELVLQRADGHDARIKLHVNS
jgi:hypothetical protein